ncbi:MAG: adenylate/guanylate cyclase domain-containing protein [Candidatus Promineifilaceae bacterium]|nr:adenylate/guanylate cyclase domain-containing protein [Candidatus Promineifilaceae bacterium]
MIESSSSSTEIESFWGHWFIVPENITRAERRAYTIERITIPAPWLLHLFYIFLFAFWRIWPLAILNVLSVTMWTAAFLAFRRQRLSLAILLIIIEVLLHTTLVVVFLGWGFGVQYYLILLSVALVLVTLWSVWLNLSVVALSALLFVALFYYTEFFPPLTAAPPLQMAIINMANILLTFGITVAAVTYLISETENAETELENEYKRSESLLHNVLPAAIVARLKSSQGMFPDPGQMPAASIAESFSAVSVLFADVVGFTLLSEQLTPQATVELLNKVFIAFDKLAEKYGVEKIRTIGDGYMVAAGAPLPRNDHAQALAAMALEMQVYMKEREKTAVVPLQVRIGINSGPAVAGIVGTTKFHYDLWGDMVNTASRMESYGLPGKIQIARPTYELIKDDFYCEPRGILTVKGKGEMEAWFINGARSDFDQSY